MTPPASLMHLTTSFRTLFLESARWMTFLLGNIAAGHSALRKEKSGALDGIFRKVLWQTKPHLYCHKSKSYSRPLCYHMHFNMQKKKLLGDRYVKGVKGIWARTYRKAVCMALLQSCSEGWSTSMSSLLDLKPPRLVMRVEKRRWITLSWTKVFFSKSCQGCWGMRPRPPGREYTLQDHLHLCDCIEEGR